jgi:hypothetical protein
MNRHLQAARLAVRYRREARQLRRDLVLCQSELLRVRVENSQLRDTVRRMDATNAALAHTSARRDFNPAGGFTAWPEEAS